MSDFAMKLSLMPFLFIMIIWQNQLCKVKEISNVKLRFNRIWRFTNRLCLISFGVFLTVQLYITASASASVSERLKLKKPRSHLCIEDERDGLAFWFWGTSSSTAANSSSTMYILIASVFFCLFPYRSCDTCITVQIHSVLLYKHTSCSVTGFCHLFLFRFRDCSWMQEFSLMLPHSSSKVKLNYFYLTCS